MIERNWGNTPAAAEVNNLQPWSGDPTWPTTWHLEQYRGDIDTFTRDWSALQQAWTGTATLATQNNIQALLPEVSVSAVNGQPVHTPLELRAPTPEGTRPMGGTYQIGSIFNAANGLDIRTPFDPNRLSPLIVSYSTAK